MSSLQDAKLDAILSSLHVLSEENRALRKSVHILQSSITASIDEKILTIADLTVRYKIGQTALYSNPWRLPNFGVSDFDYGAKRWRMSTVLQWEEKSDKEHEIEWNALSVSQRKKIKGVY